MSNRNNGCRGCGGRGRCTNNIQCGNGNGVNPCIPRPIVAVDANCTPPTANGTGSIVPFSSGTIPAVLVTTALGLVATGSAIGFGTSVPDIIIGPLDTIDLGILPSEAFSVPRAGNITAISASFVTTAAVAVLTGPTTIRAQIYRAPQGSTTFTATGAFVDLAPPLPAPIAIGAVATGNATVNVPVSVGDRLLMVFSATTSTAIAAAIVGNASAGITID